MDADTRSLHFEAGKIFTPGAPINERGLFAGRIKQIQAIIDTISQRGYHAVLYGERGVGKTSLSNVLADFLQEQGKTFLLPRINCDVSDTFSSVWRKLFQDITITEPRRGAGFTTADSHVRRSFVDQLPTILTPDDVRRALVHLSQGVILVTIFDEFDRPRDPTLQSLMADTIKALSDYGVAATILLIGVADSVSSLINEHQSIERALVQVPMPRMSTDEIKAIVMTGLGRLSMNASPDALEEIVILSQGLPYITHLLALHTTRSALEANRKELLPDDVSSGIGLALAQWQESIKSSYYHATKSQQPGNIYKEVLLACALAETDELGFFSAASVREPLRQITRRNYDIPNFARHLKELSQQGRGDMLFRTGVQRRLRYRFNSPIMRPYIVMRGIQDGLIRKCDIPTNVSFLHASR